MKKLISLILTVLFVLSPAVYAVPVMETVENADAALAQVDAESSTVLSVSPGINIFTGTTDVQDFEGEDVLDYVTLSEKYDVTIATRKYDLDAANVIENNKAVKISEIRGNVSAKNFPLITRSSPVSVRNSVINRFRHWIP